MSGVDGAADPPEYERKCDLPRAARTADLVVSSTAAHHLLCDVVSGSVPDALANESNVTVLPVQSDQSRPGTFRRSLLERVAF